MKPPDASRLSTFLASLAGDLPHFIFRPVDEVSGIRVLVLLCWRRDGGRQASPDPTSAPGRDGRRREEEERPETAAAAAGTAEQMHTCTTARYDKRIHHDG